MKKKFTRKLAILMTSLILSGVLCSAAPPTGVIQFSDVSAEYWGYTTIMQMAKAGIFKGTTDPVNGVGTFSPEKVMSRAEFITAALRAVYPDEASLIQNGTARWWDNYYVFAFQKGIVKWTELDSGDLDKPMTRAEMAMVLVRCVEKNGEKLKQRIKTTQIPDYDKIGDHYKDYVLDCFSFGLLCGVDDNGTFAPDVLLTRAQAATVICRLIDKNMRIEVEFIEEPETDSGNNFNPGNTGSENGNGSWKPNVGVGNNNQGSMDRDEDDDIPTIDDELITPTPEPEEKIELPWENGGKQPSEYTWAEFEALSGTQKDAFIESFGSTDEFNAWATKAQGSQNTEKLPWENGGKQPSKYTWAEFEALNGTQKDAFIESFGNPEAFNAWATKVQGSQGGEKLPWENGGKQPSKYTWAEFEALPGKQKDAFIESFGSTDEFIAWATKAQGSQNTEKLPWENGGKQPSKYTWAEFEALNGTQKDAFIESFGNPEAFNAWATKVQGSQNSEKLPWENGGKQPSEYTWAEFEALPNKQKDAFIESFPSDEARAAWFNTNSK